MRILEEKLWGIEMECPGCGSHLGIEGEDVRYGDFGVQYADDHDWCFYVQCPVCETHIRRGLQALPPQVEKMAKWKAKL